MDLLQNGCIYIEETIHDTAHSGMCEMPQGYGEIQATGGIQDTSEIPTYRRDIPKIYTRQSQGRALIIFVRIIRLNFKQHYGEMYT